MAIAESRPAHHDGEPPAADRVRVEEVQARRVDDEGDPSAGQR